MQRSSQDHLNADALYSANFLSEGESPDALPALTHTSRSSELAPRSATEWSGWRDTQQLSEATSASHADPNIASSRRPVRGYVPHLASEEDTYFPNLATPGYQFPENQQPNSTLQSGQSYLNSLPGRSAGAYTQPYQTQKPLYAQGVVNRSPQPFALHAPINVGPGSPGEFIGYGFTGRYQQPSYPGPQFNNSGQGFHPSSMPPPRLPGTVSSTSQSSANSSISRTPAYTFTEPLTQLPPSDRIEEGETVPNAALNNTTFPNAVSGGNGASELTLTLTRNSLPVPSGNFNLSFQDAAGVRSTAYPRVRRLDPSDADEFERHSIQNVRRIMRAIDDTDHQEPPPDYKQGSSSADKIKSWNKWHNDAHTEAREVIDADSEHKFVEARSWMIHEEIINVQRHGLLRQYAKGDTSRTCSERLKMIIDKLKHCPIIRALAVDDMDIPRFVTNPFLYTKEKETSQRQNYKRAVATKGKKRKNEDSSQASDNQPVRDLQTRVIAQQLKDSSNSPSPKKRALGGLVDQDKEINVTPKSKRSPKERAGSKKKAGERAVAEAEIRNPLSNPGAFVNQDIAGRHTLNAFPNQ